MLRSAILEHWSKFIGRWMSLLRVLCFFIMFRLLSSIARIFGMLHHSYKGNPAIEPRRTCRIKFIFDKPGMWEIWELNISSLSCSVTWWAIGRARLTSRCISSFMVLHTAEFSMRATCGRDSKTQLHKIRVRLTKVTGYSKFVCYCSIVHSSCPSA